MRLPVRFHAFRALGSTSFLTSHVILQCGMTADFFSLLTFPRCFNIMMRHWVITILLPGALSLFDK